MNCSGSQGTDRTANPRDKPEPHDRLILAHIDAHGYINDKEYARLTERAKATRTLDFNRLIGLG